MDQIGAGLGGFASRIDALSRLAANSQAIWIASLFIMLLLPLAETAPIFTKLISARSPPCVGRRIIYCTNTNMWP
ncbi:MAG: DUF4407 domain-containing protein [Saprospiraceae bacterium]|nr:DUF4407 domain-containing protein [Saprospiraceae bacterium]